MSLPPSHCGHQNERAAEPPGIMSGPREAGRKGSLRVLAGSPGRLPRVPPIRTRLGDLDQGPAPSQCFSCKYAAGCSGAWLKATVLPTAPVVTKPSQ